jgi:molybdate transport system substrate-binding protein
MHNALGGTVRRCVILPFLAFLFTAPAGAQQKLHILAAGSLTAPFTDLIHAFDAPPGSLAPPVFGPSGVLRRRIEQGEVADIFASADMANPRRLAAQRPGVSVTPFVCNTLCVQVWQRLGLTPGNLLEKMLDPKLILGTSTPHADPAGDYAWALFDRADKLRPGAGAILKAKAHPVVGGPGMTPAISGHSAVAGVFLKHQADLFLGYCSSVKALLAEVPGLVAVPVPPPLAPEGSDRAEYGMAVLSNSDLAHRFAAFVLSPHGQAVFARYGFEPIAAR